MQGELEPHGSAGKFPDEEYLRRRFRQKTPHRWGMSSRNRLDMPSSPFERPGRPMRPIVGNNRIDNFPTRKASIPEKVDLPRIIFEILEPFFNHNAFASWTVHVVPPDGLGALAHAFWF
jgi:hypothetical protein